MSSTGDVEGSGEAHHRFTATIEKDLAKNTQKQVLTEWTSSDIGNPLNWAGVLSQGGLSISTRLPGESQELVQDGMRIWHDNSNKPVGQILPEPKPQYLGETEMIGSGLLSIEDAKLMKEFLGSEEVKNYVYGVAKGFVMAPVDMAKDSVDLGKAVIKYGSEPATIKLLQVSLALEKWKEFHNRHSASEEWKIIGSAAWKVVKGICQDATTAEGQGRILGEAVFGLCISRAAKSLKIAGEVIEEAADFSKREHGVGVIEDGVCPREFGLADKSDIKSHIDADDLGKKVDDFATPKNCDFYTKYKVDTELPWGNEYNEWIKVVDADDLQLHHVFSNKGESATAICNHQIFKDGLLDVKMLDSEKNIMPLPKKPGMHPTMNVHWGGRHTNQYKMDMNEALSKISEEFRSMKITKDQAESRFWEAVDKEKTRLFRGESNIYKKKN